MGVWFRSIALLVAASPAVAVADSDIHSESLRAFAGTYETARLLESPPVADELHRLAGDRLAHLQRNLSVTGPIDLVAGWLSVAGNAPHQGTEQEAVVCVRGDGAAIHAAILSGAEIVVLTTATDYADLPLCIKDWMALANSRHRGRQVQPANARLVRPSSLNGSPGHAPDVQQVPAGHH